MKSIKESGTSGCTFLWKIENISHCWLKKNERLESPKFIANTVDETKWSLSLYPRGYITKNFVSVFLSRETDCCGPDNIAVHFQLEFLDKDGSSLKKVIRFINNFKKDEVWCCKEFEQQEKNFNTEREAFLPNDTLTVQCTIWQIDKTPVEPKCLSARTVLKVNRRCFVWRIAQFSTLKSGQRNKFKDESMEFDLILNEGLDYQKSLALEIIAFDDSIKYFSFKTSIIDLNLKKEDFGTYEYFAKELKKGILSSPLFTKKLMVNKSRFLPNDVLSLDFEYVYSTGTILYELSNFGIISPKVTKEAVEKNTFYVLKEKSQQAANLANDLKSMYNEAVLSDIEIRTSTKIFPAHKTILSARSSVFRRMFSNDMKEKNSGRVDITDLEDDTLQRMLLYFYTDSLEDLQWENASKLYTAAEKYDILTLKTSCSSFLQENLCPTKVCEVLVLADLQQDEDLKCAVQNYILDHDREVFGSQEWKDFMNLNSKLAADIMYRKVYQE